MIGTNTDKQTAITVGAAMRKIRADNVSRLLELAWRYFSVLSARETYDQVEPAPSAWASEFERQRNSFQFLIMFGCGSISRLIENFN